MQPILIKLQRWLVLNKNLILNGFRALEIGAVVLYAVAAYAFINDTDAMVFWYELGRRLGQVALFLYLITLIPGILTRLQFQPLIGAMLMPFRRHFGILMFLAALLHSGLTTTLLAMVTGQIPVLMQPHLMGVIALLILLPLWLTSNDTSQQKLGKGWKMLHRLTYLALLFIFLHVSAMRTSWMILTGSVLLLEVASWIKVWLKQRSAQPPTPPPAVPSITDQSSP